MKKVAFVFIFLFLSSSPLFPQESPLELQALLKESFLFKQNFQYEKAIEILENSQLKNEPEVEIYLAKLFYLSGQSQEAYGLISSLADNWRHYIYLGLICEDLGYIQEAISAYQNSLQLQENSIALFRLGKIYQNRNDCQKAAFFFQRAINLDSSIRLAYYYLGQAFSCLKNYREAYRYLSRAASFYPHNLKIKEELEAARQALGKDFFIRERKEREKRRKTVALKPYYPKTGIPLVRIGLAVGVDEFSFQSPGGFRIAGEKEYEGKPGVFYTFKVQREKLFLFCRNSGDKLAVFPFPAIIKPLISNGKQYPFYLLDVVYGYQDYWQAAVDSAYRGKFELVLKNGKLNLVNILSIEEYLYGVLAAEMPSWASQEALKAQAILARSLVLRRKGRHSGEGFDFCAQTHCQVYRGMAAETKATKAAVAATQGEIILYQGKIPEIFYHSNCGGCLSSDIFGEREYLAAGFEKPDKLPFDSAYWWRNWFVQRPPQHYSFNQTANFRWQRIYDWQDFKLIFSAEIDKLNTIEVKSKKQCFRLGQIDVLWQEKKVSLKNGLAVRNYFDGLRSSAFWLEHKKSGLKQPGIIIFWGAGFGHGSGMSQEGAMNMAQSGYSYQEILKHYYPRVEIEKNH